MPSPSLPEKTVRAAPGDAVVASGEPSGPGFVRVPRLRTPPDRPAEVGVLAQAPRGREPTHARVPSRGRGAGDPGETRHDP